MLKSSHTVSVVTSLLVTLVVGCSAGASDEVVGENGDTAAAQDLAAGQGLAGEYFSDVKLTNKVLSRTDADVNFDWSTNAPASNVARTNFSVRWTGYIEPAFSETYTFLTSSDDGVRLWVNGEPLVDDWTAHAVKQESATIALKAGQRYPIELEYFQAAGGAKVSLSWSSTHQAREIVPSSALFLAPASTCPAAAQKGGAALWANLEACGWPGAKNTGPTTTALKTQGTEIITTEGITFKDAIVNGCIIVKAKNVTIQNVRVNFEEDGSNCTSRGGWAAINVTEGYSATINDTEVNGNGKVHIGIRNAGQRLTLSKVNVHDVEDGVYANISADARKLDPGAGSNTIVTDSYFHAFVPRSFNNKTMVDTSRANGHMDGFQTDGGATNTQLIHNTYDMKVGVYTPVYSDGTSTPPKGSTSNGFIDSATALWNGDDYDLTNILVEKNLFAAQNGFVHYVYDRTGISGKSCVASAAGAPNQCGSVLDARFLNNRYSTVYQPCIGSYGVWFNDGAPTGGWAATGNERSGNEVIENGQSVDESATPLRANGSHCQ